MVGDYEVERDFYEQLARTIQSWLWVESEIYRMYAAIMGGANPHLISATFHKFQSARSQLGLIDACLALIFSKESSHWKNWRSLQKDTNTLEDKRNKIVHESVHFTHAEGQISISIEPSSDNALVFTRGQTTHNGPVISPSYKPSKAKIKDDQKIYIEDLLVIEREFKDHAERMKNYREQISGELEVAVKSK